MRHGSHAGLREVKLNRPVARNAAAIRFRWAEYPAAYRFQGEIRKVSAGSGNAESRLRDIPCRIDVDLHSHAHRALNARQGRAGCLRQNLIEHLTAFGRGIGISGRGSRRSFTAAQNGACRRNGWCRRRRPCWSLHWLRCRLFYAAGGGTCAFCRSAGHTWRHRGGNRLGCSFLAVAQNLRQGDDGDQNQHSSKERNDIIRQDNRLSRLARRRWSRNTRHWRTRYCRTRSRGR